eukprot:Skav200978  [mRNA]  locus=scaffold1596:46490:50581:- [translate_table: standard]
MLRNKDVAAKYFLTFYPGADEAAAVFGTSVGEVSMAQLQHFFLACHRQGFDATKATVTEDREAAKAERENGGKENPKELKESKSRAELKESKSRTELKEEPPEEAPKEPKELGEKGERAERGDKERRDSY